MKFAATRYQSLIASRILVITTILSLVSSKDVKSNAFRASQNLEKLKDVKDIEKMEETYSIPARNPVMLNAHIHWSQLMTGPGVWPIMFAPYPQPGSPWPVPTKINQTEDLLLIDVAVFNFSVEKVSNPILEYNIARYRTIIAEQKNVSVISNFARARAFEKQAAPNPRIVTVSVIVERDGEAYPHLKMDESYSLDVSISGKAQIRAAETWGAIRALETFAQLVIVTPDDSLFINVTSIEDAPQYPYRGLLIDTARHFIEKQTLLRNLDAMAMNKLNVFHWHLVDDSSFPFESKVWPQLSARGSYDPLSKVYSHEDVKEIVEYARMRGIRVVPEFDTPGHTFSWGKGYPQLLTPCYTVQEKTASAEFLTKSKNSIVIGDNVWTFDNTFGPMNIAKNFTYEFLEKLFTEVSSLFPDEYIHLGGDEVMIGCLRSNPLVIAAFQSSNFTSNEVLSHHFGTIDAILNRIGKARGKPFIGQYWHEVFSPLLKVRENSIIQVWQPDWMVPKLPPSRFNLIYSACWYLDHSKHWIDYYNCDQTLRDYFADKENKKFLGGESCMWTEYQDDFTLLSKIWPAAASAAERLWSAIDPKDYTTVAPRLEEHRCRMIARGIPAAVTTGSGTCNRITEKHRRKYQTFKSSNNNTAISFVVDKVVAPVPNFSNQSELNLEAVYHDLKNRRKKFMLRTALIASAALIIVTVLIGVTMYVSLNFRKRFFFMCREQVYSSRGFMRVKFLLAFVFVLAVAATSAQFLMLDK